MNRKEFLQKSGLAAGALVVQGGSHFPRPVNQVKFGIIADLHHDIMHDGLERLASFVEEMNQVQPDFIIQMGDFCLPKTENLPLMKTWDGFKGQGYHVIGNHDAEKGFTREQVVAFWNSPRRYYSFDKNGYHFVVLDGNEHNEDANRPQGYARYISTEQIAWLKNDLGGITTPTVVFCHQGLDNDFGRIENATLVRYTLEQARLINGEPKVKMVISGHHHQDYYNVINQIHYLQINSASYQWLGKDHEEIRYSKEVDSIRPLIKRTVPYRDPLWAIVELEDLDRISVKGKRTEFVGSSPEQLGVNLQKYIYPIVPYISNRQIRL